MCLWSCAAQAMWRALLVGLALACADVAPCVMHMNHDGVVYKVELRSGMDFEAVATKFVRQRSGKVLPRVECFYEWRARSAADQLSGDA